MSNIYNSLNEPFPFPHPTDEDFQGDAQAFSLNFENVLFPFTSLAFGLVGAVFCALFEALLKKTRKTSLRKLEDRVDKKHNMKFLH